MLITKFLLAATTAGALCFSASASGAQDIKTETFRVEAGELGTASGRHAVLARLEQTARRVCYRDYDERDLSVSAEVHACRRESLLRAVHTIGSVELIQAMNARFGVPASQTADVRGDTMIARR